jgi:hypothetical protein
MNVFRLVKLVKCAKIFFDNFDTLLGVNFRNIKGGN